MMINECNFYLFHSQKMIMKSTIWIFFFSIVACRIWAGITAGLFLQIRNCIIENQETDETELHIQKIRENLLKMSWRSKSIIAIACACKQKCH